MKNPFVQTSKAETFAYPAPLERDHMAVDPEVLEAIDGGEQAPWIKIRVPLSAKDQDAVADYTQAVIVGIGSNGDGGGMEQRVGRTNRGLFGHLVEGWSFTEREPTLEDYDKLDGWAAAWVRRCIGEAVRLGDLDFTKKEPTSSKQPEGSPESPLSEPVAG